MISDRRKALDEIIIKMRSGRMTRRTFLERATAIGLTITASVSLLEACGSSSSKVIPLVWQSENDTSGAYEQIVDNFNKASKDVHIVWHNGSSGIGDLPTMERNVLQAHSTAVDVMSIDIIYVAEFATNRWVVPITDSQWPISKRSNYLSGPIKGCTFEDKLWAAPFRTDVGLMYYRKDIIPNPPKSWEELTKLASDNKSKARYGYIWQGAQYEGLVCNFCEILHGYGGAILDWNDSTKITVESPEAIQALTEMVNWVGTISPNDVTTYREESTRTAWQNGDAIFMRNWPYAYAHTKIASESKIVNKFDISSIPYGGSHSTTGHSTIGGWQLAINAFIDSDKQQAAWNFIKYMLGPEAQKIGATVATWAVTLSSIYDENDVLEKTPLFKQLKPIVQTALPRPVTPKYKDVSAAIQFSIYQALTRKKQPRDALVALASNLKSLVVNH